MARDEVRYLVSYTHFSHIEVSLSSVNMRQLCSRPSGVWGMALNIPELFHAAIDSFVSTPSIQHLELEKYAINKFIQIRCYLVVSSINTLSNNVIIIVKASS